MNSMGDSNIILQETVKLRNVPGLMPLLVKLAISIPLITSLIQHWPSLLYSVSLEIRVHALHSGRKYNHTR